MGWPRKQCHWKFPSEQFKVGKMALFQLPSASFVASFYLFFYWNSSPVNSWAVFWETLDLATSYRLEELVIIIPPYENTMFPSRGINSDPGYAELGSGQRNSDHRVQKA